MHIFTQLLIKLCTLPPWKTCTRTLILHKKPYRLLKPFQETIKDKMLLQLTEIRTAYQYLRTARMTQCIPLIMHCLD